MAKDQDSVDQESPQREESPQQESSSDEPSLVSPSSQNGQIPLLDDVVFNTALPFPKPKPAARQKPPHDKNAPRATDLFGGSPETAQAGPLSNHYDAVDIDKTTRQVKDRTDRVVDSLVAEYSYEIVERLRNELTAVLEDLLPERPAALPEEQQEAPPEALSEEPSEELPQELSKQPQEKPDQT